MTILAGRTAPRPLTRVVALVTAAFLAVAGTLVVGEGPASANTPSDYSTTIYVGSAPGYAGLPLTVGWTKDHAWVIASWAAALTAGSGQIASELCDAVSGEEIPLVNPVGSACQTLAEQVVAQLVAGRPRLTNHGLWMAFYVWNGRTTTSGTW